MLLAMVAEPSLESFQGPARRGAGRSPTRSRRDEGPGKVPLYEYAWNHTTLQMLKADRGVTYLQCLYPYDRLMEAPST